MRIEQTSEWQALEAHAEAIKATHLRELMADDDRVARMYVEHRGIAFDFARQNATIETLGLLTALAEGADLRAKIDAMFAGEHINATEDRAVLHVALRGARDADYAVDGAPVMGDVYAVRDKIDAFADAVRRGAHVGATGKPLTNVVAIGIGGSYLGPEFVAEALRTSPGPAAAAEGRTLRFLANVDPVDVARALDGLDPETTLAIIVSKTFTTAETMLNARTVRQWLKDGIDADNDAIVRQHMVAVSTNHEGVAAFGIDTNNMFGFWSWVGGRYSVTSAVGLLPLTLHYGAEATEQFIAGARDIDDHLRTAPFDQNLPVLMGLLGVWNASFMGRSARALLPYAQALHKLAPHVQQVDMESNGKRVTVDGEVLGFEAGEIDFGEPGTNGQHSFYQLIHQGRVIPCDFIGFAQSQQPVALEGEVVSNHDELMANFFAQPDALAFGKTADELRAEGVAEALIPHKTFEGNRPSSSLLLPVLDAFATGQLLALYEHRTAVQGFIWGLNSFDQWGVELGKVLAKRVRTQLHDARTEGAKVAGFNASTARLLAKYLG